MYLWDMGGKGFWEVTRYHFVLDGNSGWSFTVSVCIIATAGRLECLSDHLFSL